MRKKGFKRKGEEPSQGLSPPLPANSSGRLWSRFSGRHPPLPLEPRGRPVSEPAMQRLLSGRSRGARASAAAVTEPTGWAGGEEAGGGCWRQRGEIAGKPAQFLFSGRNRCLQN